jgi:hypothetical protein
MKIGVFALLAVSVATPAAADQKAEDIARAMMQAMGGQDAWNKAHFIRFDFIASANGRELIKRSHLWDRRTGRYRFEDKADNEAPAVVLFTNITKQQGSVYLDGKKIDGAMAAKSLKGAYRAYMDDIYWLALPWKWLDPGVHLTYMGQKNWSGKPFDIVQVTFDQGIGPAPGDRYTAYVSPRTHLMEHCEYLAQNGQTSDWDWQYTTTAGIKLASNHTNAKHGSINMGNVQVLERVDDAFLTDPHHGLDQLGK